MATQPESIAVTLEGDGVLGTSYGDGTNGIRTAVINVQDIDLLVFDVTLTGGDASTVLTAKMEMGNDNYADDGFWPGVKNTGGVITADEPTIASSAFSADGTFRLKVDVTGATKCRLLMLANAETGTPVVAFMMSADSSISEHIPGISQVVPA